MKAKVRLALLSLCLIVDAGAAHAQKLYPVSGPLASQPNPPVFRGRIGTGITSLGLAKLLKSWTVANKEVLKGKVKEVTASAMNPKTPGTPESYPPQPNLAFAWDAIYGKGYFEAHVLGNPMLQGVFTGPQGTVLQVGMHPDG